MSENNYKAAYERQKQARAIAEELLESRSRELYEASQSLRYAYNKLKNQEQQIVHQEKLASIGQLSAGVAHEINNPTAYVKSNMSTLKTHGAAINEYIAGVDALVSSYCDSHANAGEEADCQQLINDIARLKHKTDIDYVMQDFREIILECQEGVARIESIVKGLKDFSKPDYGEMELINLRECVDSTIKLVYHQVKHKMTIEERVDESLFIEGYRGAFSQVVLNIVINAFHAVGDNGVLVISAKSDNDLVELSFKDNGPGIADAITRKIFEPFFTTKEQSTGTGLGLSISASIVKSHGGILEVQSNEGEGAEFVIRVPQA